MRIAIVSDIHGNRTAFDAVLADLHDQAPDLILHGGDLADGGSSPGEIIDRIRDLGWRGVAGNGENALVHPESLERFAGQSPAPASLWGAVREMMAFSRGVLGLERMAWLGGIPQIESEGTVALVHASPGDTWRAPGREASAQELIAAYSGLGRRVAVYGHIHLPFARAVSGELVVANSGSVGLPYDNDPRASYLVLDDSHVTIRRVEYDIEKEIRALHASGLPHADWVERMLRGASPQMP